MSLTLYGLKNCDTCKNALKALEGAGKTVAFVDIRAEADLPRLLPGWLDVAGSDLLINRRSTTWRTLSEAARAQPALDLLTAHATLIKRPVIAHGNDVHVGWSKDVQAALL